MTTLGIRGPMVGMTTLGWETVLTELKRGFLRVGRNSCWHQGFCTILILLTCVLRFFRHRGIDFGQRYGKE